MNLGNLWRKIRPKRIGMIPVWTGFLTLLVSVLSFGVIYLGDQVQREVTFYVVQNDFRGFDQYIGRIYQLIPYEYWDKFQIHPHPFLLWDVERGIERYRVGSLTKNDQGWTLRYFGESEENKEHADILFNLIKNSMQEYFRDHETLSEYYKLGRLEYSFNDYNPWARERHGRRKHPDLVYEIWLGYNY